MCIRDKISGLVWLLAGLFITIKSIFSLGLGSLKDPGAGFFPLIVGSGLSVLSLVILARAFFAKAEDDRSIKELWSGLNWPKVFYTIGVLVIYPMILDWVGFLLTSLFILALLCIGIEPKKWKLGIGLSIIASVCSYILFDRVLQVQLPRGLLGF